MSGSLISRQLEYFAAAYRMRSIAEAAKSIPITYQGLKKALGNLERDLGVRLFDIDDSGTLKPTREAEFVYDFAMRQMREAAELEALLARSTAGPTVVKICAAIGTIAYLGYDLMNEFDAENPDLHLEVDEVYDAEVDDLLVSGKYTLGIAAAPLPGSLRLETLAQNGCIAWVNLDNPSSRKNALTIADLAGQRIMIPNRHVKAHRFFREAFERIGVEPNAITSCPNPSASYLYAKENQGVGIGVEDVPNYGTSADRVKQLIVEDGYQYIFGAARRGGAATNRRRRSAAWSSSSRNAPGSGRRAKPGCRRRVARTKKRAAS
ncbi:MAG: LysR family transcriptional regulator [Eggerthellaceae bacterium]|nr:LysR family transcriptional regulator [Eggerthellaceae bacterium]